MRCVPILIGFESQDFQILSQSSRSGIIVLQMGFNTNKDFRQHLVLGASSICTHVFMDLKHNLQLNRIASELQLLLKDFTFKEVFFFSYSKIFTQKLSVPEWFNSLHLDSNGKILKCSYCNIV